MRPRYPLVIFDFDGTLADTFAWFVRALSENSARFGLRTLAPTELATLRQFEPRQLLDHLGLSWWKLPLLARSMRAHMAAHLQGIRLFDGIEEVLRSLALENVTLGIVTSNSEANVRTILGPANADLIALYECGTSLFGKSARFRRMLKRTGLTPADAIYIGDELRDSDAARAEKIPFGAVSWGYADRATLAARSPAILFERPAQITAHLTR